MATETGAVGAGGEMMVAETETDRAAVTATDAATEMAGEIGPLIATGEASGPCPPVAAAETGMAGETVTAGVNAGVTDRPTPMMK